MCGCQEIMNLICTYRGRFKLKRQEFWVDISFFECNKMFVLYCVVFLKKNNFMLRTLASRWNKERLDVYEVKIEESEKSQQPQNWLLAFFTLFSPHKHLIFP